MKYMYILPLMPKNISGITTFSKKGTRMQIVFKERLAICEIKIRSNIEITMVTSKVRGFF